MRHSRQPVRCAFAALALVVTFAACTPQQATNVAIHLIFGDHADEAHAVVECESGHNHLAVSPDGSNHGLFQINNVHRSTFEQVTGKPWADRYDPVLNTAFAKWLYDQQGWRPWSCRP